MSRKSARYRLLKGATPSTRLDDSSLQRRLSRPEVTFVTTPILEQWRRERAKKTIAEELFGVLGQLSMSLTELDLVQTIFVRLFMS
jgi:hypothetical protein